MKRLLALCFWIGLAAAAFAVGGDGPASSLTLRDATDPATKLKINLDGSVNVVSSSLPLPTGTNTIGKVGIDPTANGVVATPPVVPAVSGSAPMTAAGVAVVSADLRAYPAAVLTLTGTWTGTITFQGGGQDSTFAATTNVAGLYQTGSTIASGSSATNNVQVTIPGGGFLRAQITTAGTGTAFATIQPLLQSPPAGSMGVTAQQTGTWITVPAPNTGQGITGFYKLISAATTNAATIKASPGGFASLIATNTSASWRYFKIYNKASNPTVGTDVPLQAIPLPPGQTVVVNTGPFAWRFATGLAMSITANFADSDATAVGVNEVMVNVGFF